MDVQYAIFVHPFFLLAMFRPEQDIQKESVNAHHDRNAHQITGHAPFHQSKSFQEEPIQITTGMFEASLVIDQTTFICVYKLTQI